MKRLLLPASAVVLVLMASGVSSGAASPQRGKPAAAREAERLLAAYVPPRGAVRLDRAPAGHRWLMGDPGQGLYGKRVDRHRYWLVHASVASIEKSLERSRLPGWNAAGIDSTGAKRGGLLNTEGLYAHVGFGGRSTGRLLRVAAAKAHGGGSILRVDVVVVWQLSASERENLPVGVREIDIHGPHAGNQVVVDPAQVRTVVRWFNELEIVQPLTGYLGCPLMLREPIFTFVFRGAHGALLAKVRVPESSGLCSPATYAIRGHAVNSLIGGDIDFRVQELIGANWFGPPDMLGLATQRQGQAAHTAAALLHNFRPPPGATRSSAPREYGGMILNPGGPFGEVVDRVRFWRVRASLSSVLSFVKAHDVPPGFRVGGGQVSKSAQELGYYSLPVGSRYFDITALHERNGTTIVRVDAQVVWVYPRSPTESVRAARVREIDFSAPTILRRATDPAVIARIVRWFNALPIVPPATGAGPGCLLIHTAPIALAFRGAGGKLLARASVVATEPQGLSGICNSMDVQITGANQPSLLGGKFVGRVQRLIGVTVKVSTSPRR